MLVHKQEQYEFWTSYSKNFSYPYAIGKIKIKAIATKALRQGFLEDLIIAELMDDICVKTVKEEIGKEKTARVLSDLINEAREDELAYNLVA